MSALGRRSLLVASAGLLAARSAAAEGGGPWAVELFTSQGCSSCPPADRLLGKLARRPDIVALSFHVDYWDYIGWKDRFASKATTERQRAYARTLKQRYVYTPDGGLEIRLAAAKLEAGAADVTVFAYDRQHSTPVGRGENEGRRLDNFNVVRRFEVVSRWNGAEAHWTVPADRFEPGQGLAVIVQQPDHGVVLGCAKVETGLAG